MIDLKSRLQMTLQTAGYSTWLTVAEDFEVVGFEDPVIMGFACLFEDAKTLVSKWRSVETVLLAKHAHLLQRAGDKSWNLYLVLLCGAATTEFETAEVRWIEEDLERTRKLAACNISDEDRLITALLPLLPIQSQAILERDELDVTKRLMRRIESIAPRVARVALDPDVSPSDVLLALGAEP